MAVNQDVIVDIDLLQKYDKPGPRYTSYPTVPFWADDHINSNDWLSTAIPPVVGVTVIIA